VRSIELDTRIARATHGSKRHVVYPIPIRNVKELGSNRPGAHCAGPPAEAGQGSDPEIQVEGMVPSTVNLGVPLPKQAAER